MEYQTQENRIRPDTNSGDKYIDTYVEAIDKKGKTYLKKSGSTNIYEKIQAALDETKTYNILEKYMQTGDENLINKRQKIFGNFIQLPTTPIELQNIIIQAEKQFDSLDKEVREAFENDSGIFKQSILDGSFEQKIKQFNQDKEKMTQNIIQQQLKRENMQSKQEIIDNE